MARGRVAPPRGPNTTAAVRSRSPIEPRGEDDRADDPTPDGPPDDRAPDDPRSDDFRELTSYVRRSGRMTAGQKRAWDMDARRFVIPMTTRPSGVVLPTAPLDLPAVYGRSAPLVVEIGPGMGDSLVAMAADRPEVDILAFEVYHASVASIVHKLAAADLTNVRLVMADAASGLQHLIGPGGLSELWTFFPDPWHKNRHHKRRLVSRGFADLVAERLRPGGRWRLATDWQDYAQWMVAALRDHPDLINDHADDTGPGWAPRWPDRPLTKFEARGIAEGRTVRDLSYRRR